MNYYGTIILFYEEGLIFVYLYTECIDIIVLHCRLHLHLSQQKKQREGEGCFFL